MRLFERYERVVVISLPERTDRRREMVRNLGPIEFFDAVRPFDKGPFQSIGAHGCYLSHLAVLKQGGSVLILEDDCDFLPHAFDYRVPPVGVFYGGWLEMTDSYIIGSHCMGFNARAAKLAASYLTNLLDPDFPADPQAASELGFNPAIRPPVDGAYVWFRRAHPELTTEFARISVQRPSRSDCTPGRFDGIPALRPIAQLGRKLRMVYA